MTTNDLSDEESDSISVIVSDECDRNGDIPEDGTKVVSIFVGNLGERTGPCEIKNLFESFGVVVDHIDMKVCFAFVHCPWVSNLADLVLKMQGCLFEHRYDIEFDVHQSNNCQMNTSSTSL